MSHGIEATGDFAGAFDDEEVGKSAVNGITNAIDIWSASVPRRMGALKGQNIHRDEANGATDTDRQGDTSNFSTTIHQHGSMLDLREQPSIFLGNATAHEVFAILAPLGPRFWVDVVIRALQHAVSCALSTAWRKFILTVSLSPDFLDDFSLFPFIIFFAPNFRITLAMIVVGRTEQQ